MGPKTLGQKKILVPRYQVSTPPSSSWTLSSLPLLGASITPKRLYGQYECLKIRLQQSLFLMIQRLRNQDIKTQLLLLPSSSRKFWVWKMSGLKKKLSPKTNVGRNMIHFLKNLRPEKKFVLKRKKVWVWKKVCVWKKFASKKNFGSERIKIPKNKF